MIQSYKDFWKRYADFKGVSNKAQFWWAWLINLCIQITAIIIILPTLLQIDEYTDDISGTIAPPSISLVFIVFFTFWIIFSLITICPNIAIAIRRLKDAGFEWWVYLILLFVPFGRLIALGMYLTPSKNVINDILGEKKEISAFPYTDKVKNYCLVLEKAWNDENLDSVKSLYYLDLYMNHKRKLNNFKVKGLKNYIKDIEIMEFKNYIDANTRFSIDIIVKYKSYTLRPSSNQIIEGSLESKFTTKRLIFIKDGQNLKLRDIIPIVE